MYGCVNRFGFERVFDRYGRGSENKLVFYGIVESARPLQIEKIDRICFEKRIAPAVDMILFRTTHANTILVNTDNIVN